MCRKLIYLVSLVLVLGILTPAAQGNGYDGYLVAWGRNSYGQCDVPEGDKFVAIAAGSDHSLGLKSDGSVVAWGRNQFGQSEVPADNNDFVAIAAGLQHNLALKSNGSIVGWGDNSAGQSNVPADNNDFVAVAGGGWHSLGLKSDGSVVAWGHNAYGQSDPPADNNDFIAIAGGDVHSLGLKSDGSVVAWGSNSAGQSNVPADNNDFVAVAGGGWHSLGLKSDGSVVAWGSNGYGQSDPPADNNDFVAIAGGWYHSLALKDDGSVVAWGRNNYGQTDVPADNNDFIAISGGYAHSLAISRPRPSCEIPVYKDDIKWSQPPVEDDWGCINGWDEVSIYYNEPIIADDWICLDDRPIKDIHWWGSFKGWKEPNCVPPAEIPDAFHIGIWTDIPDPDPCNPNTFSHPGRLIWENICDCYVWSFAGYDLDPRGIDQNDACFKFDQLLSQDKWFYQDPSYDPNNPTIYWLSIAAIYDPCEPIPEYPWGWKTRPHFCKDDAVRILPPVAFCPNDCPDPNLSEFWAGEPDDFNLPTEDAVPLGDFNDWVENHPAAPRDFDECGNDKIFGHTFVGLPPCIVAAQLEIHMKTCGCVSYNDSLDLEFLGGSPTFAWGKYVKDLPLVPGGPPIGSWNHPDVNTFTLDLNNLIPSGSGVTSVLEHLADGDLDVYIQDDTAVDYMILRVWSCPLVTGQWPPEIGSFWENGEPIEYPEGTSWDMAFVLTTNRKYTPRKWHWSNKEAGAVDIHPDGTINFMDFAIMAEHWLEQAELYPCDGDC